MTATAEPTRDTRTLAERAAALPASARFLLSELSGLDLGPMRTDDPAGLRAYRRTLLDARVSLDFDDRHEIDAELAELDDDFRESARHGGSADFTADPHGVIARALEPGFGDWLDHAARARGCTRPVRLSGVVEVHETKSGRVVDVFDTATLPDGVIYKPCGTRRASVCPACAEVYRYDTYHLIAAGLRGGKGVPETVTAHPAVFATFTAPSFGAVHSRKVKAHRSTCGRKNGLGCACPTDPCHPRRDNPRCVHGRAESCTARHAEGDRRLGRPLCLDCYDHAHQAVWNHFVPKLWSRTVQQLQRIAKRHGCIVRYAKVAEFQRRGVVHLHALLRLDARPGEGEDRDALIPPLHVTAEELEDWIKAAASSTGLDSPPHPATGQSWPILWGQRGVDTDVVHRGLPGAELTEQHVAGYLAKYATKACEPAGLVAGRITDDTIGHYRTKGDPHLRALIAACWDLGTPADPAPAAPIPALPAAGRVTQLGGRWTCPACGSSTRLRICLPCDRNGHVVTRPGDTADPASAAADDTSSPEAGAYEGLRRWAHMLGFGGHFSTKSRAYSTTLGALRAARRPGNRQNVTATDPADHRDQAAADQTETTLVVGTWNYIGSGWLTNGDAALAAQAAAAARARRPRLDPHAS